MSSRRVTTYGKRTTTRFNESLDENVKPSLTNQLQSVDSILKKAKETLGLARIKEIHDQETDAMDRRMSLLKLDGADKEIDLEELKQFLKLGSAIDFGHWLNCLVKTYPKYNKIGESSFCEVFGFSKISGKTDCDMAVKIIPLSTSSSQTDKSPEPVPIQKALHEARVHTAINSLSLHRRYSIPTGYTGFNCARRITVVRGRYPESLTSIWDQWDVEGNSENHRPDFYGDDSYFLIMEMDFGGTDLEHFKIDSSEQIESIFWQLTASLVLAETQLSFEHRDLHLGNVLVKQTTRSEIRIDSKQKLETHGLMCSIIDFSLSRLQTEPKRIYYSNLEQENWLFSGDSAVSQQYDVYRSMKNLMIKDGWNEFRPRTNVLWLEFVLNALISRLPASKRKGDTLQRLQQIISALPDCSCSSDVMDLRKK